MFRDVLAGLFAVTGAAAFSQAPEFMQQYLQRLGGHLDEARRLGGDFPPLAVRVAELTQSHDSLAQSAAVAKPFVFFRHLHPEIALNTLTVYRPAVPLTVEGLIYAGLGLIFGVLLLNLLSLPFRRRRRHSQGGPSPGAAPR